MDRKKIRIFIAAFLALITLLAIFAYFSRKRTGQENQPSSESSVEKPASESGGNSFPTETPSGNRKFGMSLSPDPNKIVITTPRGEDIEVSSPSKIAENKLDEKNMVLKTTADYQILYYAYSEGPSFLISVLSSNIETARALGELNLLNILGISKTDACKLAVSVTVPQDVSAKAAGDDYRLSFCPDGKQFPR